MTDRNPPKRGIEALHARISAVGAASLRIGASLDLETTLKEVVEVADVRPPRNRSVARSWAHCCTRPPPAPAFMPCPEPERRAGHER